jgi:hypothetical protein
MEKKNSAVKPGDEALARVKEEMATVMAPLFGGIADRQEKVDRIASSASATFMAVIGTIGAALNQDFRVAGLSMVVLSTSYLTCKQAEHPQSLLRSAARAVTARIAARRPRAPASRADVVAAATLES